MVLGLAHQLLDGAAHVLAAHQRNGAEATGAVAALRNLQVGVVHRRGGHALAHQIVAVVDVEAGQQGGQLQGTEVGIHFRNFGFQVVFVALAQAAGHVELIDAALFFHVRVFEDGVDALLLGQVDETASIDDHHVGVLIVAIVHHIVVVVLELRDEVFRIDEILGATQRNDVDFIGTERTRFHIAKVRRPGDVGERAHVSGLLNKSRSVEANIGGRVYRLALVPQLEVEVRPVGLLAGITDDGHRLARFHPLADLFE